MASKKRLRVIQQLKRAAESPNMSLRAIARETGVAPITVSRIAKEEGLQVHLRKKLTPRAQSPCPEKIGVTIRSVADKIGLSVWTVSHALRNSPRVNTATTQKVQRAAQELGYQVHPYVGAQMAAIRKGRIPRIKASLAYILGGKDANWKAAYATDYGPRREFDAAKKKAAQLGYTLETYSYDADQLSAQRLEQILHAKGTKGILLDLPGNWLHYHPFQVTSYSCVALHELQHTPIHTILHDHYTNMLILYTELWLQGYRRIGYLSNAGMGNSSLYSEEAGFLMAQHQLAHHEDQISPLPVDLTARHLSHYLKHGSWLAPNTRTEETTWIQRQDWTELKKLQRRRSCNQTTIRDHLFKRWLEDQEIEAVIVQDGFFLEHMKRIGIRVPWDLGVAHFDLNTDVKGWSGIYRADEAIGASAVEMLVRSIDHGDQGFPEYPYHLRLPGKWVPGKTTKQIASPRYPLTPVVQRLVNSVLHRPGVRNLVPLR